MEGVRLDRFADILFFVVQSFKYKQPGSWVYLLGLKATQ